MLYWLAVFFIFTSLLGAEAQEFSDQKEPKCYSRFDFELKVIENIASLKAAGDQLRKTVMGLQETINTLQKERQDIPKTVAFMAQPSANMDIEPLGNVHRPIVFDQVATNVGGAYNKYTGVFTAPYSASYHFNLDISSPNHPGAHDLYVQLFRNGKVIAYVFLVNHTQYWIRRTTAVTVHLDAGDTVQAVVIKSTGSRSNTVAGCCFHSHFSGFLIGQD